MRKIVEVSKLLNWQRTKENKIEVTYSIPFAKENEIYELNVLFFDKKGNQLPRFAISGDYPSVSGSDNKTLVWDVLKDIQDFPRISKVEIRIINTTVKELEPNPAVNTEPVYTPDNNGKRPRKGVPKAKNQNEDQSSFYINLFSYEYDSKSEISKYSILSCGLYGFTWVPITINNVKLDDNSFRTIYSIGMSLYFKFGGTMFNGLDICMIGGIDYSDNKPFVKSNNDNSQNDDKITNTEYFYGIEFQTNFKLFNLFIKLGQANSYGNIQRVLPNQDYSPQSNFGTGQYQTIIIGIKIFSVANDYLRLW